MSDVYFVLLILVPIGCLISILWVDNYYLRRRIKRLRIKLTEKQRQSEPKKEHNSLLIAGYDPIECAELHLPGDCPLCGAM